MSRSAAFNGNIGQIRKYYDVMSVSDKSNVFAMQIRMLSRKYGADPQVNYVKLIVFMLICGHREVTIKSPKYRSLIDNST